MIALFLLLVIVAIALGIVGVVVKGPSRRTPVNPLCPLTGFLLQYEEPVARSP